MCPEDASVRLFTDVLGEAADEEVLCIEGDGAVIPCVRERPSLDVEESEGVLICLCREASRDLYRDLAAIEQSDLATEEGGDV